jgi:hypothetical protein
VAVGRDFIPAPSFLLILLSISSILKLTPPPVQQGRRIMTGGSLYDSDVIEKIFQETFTKDMRMIDTASHPGVSKVRSWQQRKPLSLHDRSL